MKEEEHNESEDEDEENVQIFELDGERFTSYQDFVAAKRKRNQAVLTKLGFGKDNNKRIKIGPEKSTATQRGLKSNKTKAAPLPRRKSSRISKESTKLVALDMYVNDWHKDNTSTVVTKAGDGNDESEEDEPQSYFKGRVNDGSDLSLKEAIEMNEPKWIHDDSEKTAERLFQELVGDKDASLSKGRRRGKDASCGTKSPTSVMSSSWESELTEKVENLSIDKEEWVCKVTPDRIYSVAAHPSESKLICCAGDKQGYVGLWDVDSVSSHNDNEKDNTSNSGIVSLFRVHSRPINCLEWLTNEHMVTSSYDGSVRRLNVETGVFEEIFATYDDSDTTYAEDLGYGIDQGYRFWTQSVTTDHRYKGSSNPCLFVSTSMGEVIHVDLRVSKKEKITFYEKVSEKKVNTVSLHPNGSTLATSGTDGVVRLFDIRKLKDSRNSSKLAKPLGTQTAGLSVSSSFFSPSGKSLLTTSFANRLDITEDAHLVKGGKTIKPTYGIRHNNQTGRWLTTFQARWHPQRDIFCSGSMNKPRCMEIFDASGQLLREVTGESLTSVMSRTCFHPSTNKLILVGGNSSGRVVVVR